jgi:hypothetical protein
MVRSLNVALVLALAPVMTVTGCYARPAAHSPDGLIFTPVPPPDDDEDMTMLTASTEYAYAPAPKSSPPFDAHGAREALVRAAPSGCGITGEGHAKVTFTPSGSVAHVVVDYPPNLAPPALECVREAYAKARVAEFSGAPVTLGTSFRGR